MIFFNVFWNQLVILAITAGLAAVFIMVFAYFPIWEQPFRSQKDRISHENSWGDVLKHIPWFLYITYAAAIGAFLVVFILFTQNPPATW